MLLFLATQKERVKIQINTSMLCICWCSSNEYEVRQVIAGVSVLENEGNNFVFELTVLIQWFKVLESVFKGKLPWNQNCISGFYIFIDKSELGYQLKTQITFETR